MDVRKGVEKMTDYIVPLLLFLSSLLALRKKENAYDDYAMYCNKGACENAFLYDLKNGSLNKYITTKTKSEIDKSFGVLSDNLIVS